MAKHGKYNKSSNIKDAFVNDFDDYGLDVKNVRRIKKKKVNKFKKDEYAYYGDYGDSWQTGLFYNKSVTIDILSTPSDV